jgi:hypothetical protein
MWGRSLDEFPEGSEDAVQIGIVLADAPLQRFYLFCDLIAPRQHPAKAHKGAHDLNAGPHGEWALEHVGQHHRAPCSVKT